MPANLTPQYYAAEEKYKEAKTTRDKVKALRGMLSAIPKHKGTEHLQGDLKRKIAMLTQEEEQGKKGGARGPGVDYVPREGAGQVVLVGEPNSGKSTLFAALTEAPAEIAPYPYTTLKPQPGMVFFEDVQIQLVDSPPYSDEFQEAWLPNVARMGHALLFVIDLAGEKGARAQFDDLREKLRHAGMAVVPEELPDHELPDDDWVKRAVVVGSKRDAAAEAPDRLDGYPVVPVSAEGGEGIDAIPPLLFRMLRIVRVYTKIPGKKADRKKPYVLPLDATIGDFCTQVHKDFASKLRFARLWRAGSFQGIQVHRDHDVQDGDVVELHL